MTLSSIIYHAYRNADFLLIGRFLGTEVVGIYRVAFELGMTPLDAVLQIVNRVQYPIYARLQADAAALREQVAKLMGQSLEEMGHSQWIAHILKRLHLVNEGQRKRSNDGVAYAIEPAEVRDMMRRYDVESICETSG